MNIVCFGAHPDDGEVHAGGTLAKWSRDGHRVLVVSMTNGDIGHHEMSGGALANRRRTEVQRAAEIGGYLERVLDYHDGELLPSLDVRRTVVRVIREWEADIVLTHRPCDYHPDHRYTAIAVQDAAFMVTVPHFCPAAPSLDKNPVFLYMMDRFTRPVPFQPDVAVDVGDVMDTKWAMLDAMPSQFYEWLPWIMKTPDPVPAGDAARMEWLKKQWDPVFRPVADRARDALRTRYGAAGDDVVYAELFELCEYGYCPSPDELQGLFP